MVSFVIDAARAVQVLFPGASEMASRMREFDWPGSLLGPPEHWPEALKTSVRIVLTSRHPMFVWWGEQLITLYNDGYAAFLCAKHPGALARPAAEVWPEIWHLVRSRVDVAMRRDEGTYDEALRFVMHRKGYPEETYVTFSYSPILDGSGDFGGMLCTVTEDTQRIQGERQMALLRELASKTSDAHSRREACESAATALKIDPDDLPFVMLYLIDAGAGVARLAGCCGAHSGMAQETIHLDGHSIWPLREIVTTTRACVVSEFPAVLYDSSELQGEYPVKQAITMAIAPSGSGSPMGVLIAGVNPLRQLNEDYRQLLDLVASGISAAIAHADAYEAERFRGETLAEGLASGVTDSLVKPFSARELLARITASREATLESRATLARERELRTTAEHAEMATKAELVAELAAMKGLHNFATRLLSKTEFQPLLEEVLDATIELQRADFGNVQLYNPDTHALEIVAQRGFNAEFLDYFRSVRADESACCRAMSRARMVIEDVEIDEGFAPHRHIAASTGFRAMQSTPLFGRGGQVLGILSTHFRQPHRPSERESRFTDLYAHLAAELMERHQAENALRESEERFRRYFDLGLIGMAITTPDKGCVEVNDELCRILGYERDELLKKTWAEMTHPDDLAADVAQFERVIAGEIDGYSLDKRWVRKDGRIINSLVAAKCMRRADGSVDYFVGLVLDTTERKRAEDALRLSQVQLIQAQRLSHTGSWSLDLATGILCWSEEHFRILGLDPLAPVRGYPEVLEVIHPDDRADIQAALESAIRNRSVFECDCRILRPDGTVRHIHSLAEPVLNDAGRVIELIGTIIDVTERKRTEEAVLKSQYELAHANRVAALGELSASIAHEVNQPLGAIVTNGEVCLRLLSHHADVAAIREAMDCIVADAVRASEVVKHMRTLVHKSNGAYTSIDVNDIIREVIALVAGQLTRNAVLLRTELADGIPHVFGDRVQLQQVVLNLILNANDAIKKHSVMRREIFVGSGRSGTGEFTVEVHDTGCGLDPGNLHRLFEAFFTTKSNEGGLGLGLSISRKIVEAHGGRIWARPKEAGGAIFSFTLPRA